VIQISDIRIATN